MWGRLTTVGSICWSTAEPAPAPSRRAGSQMAADVAWNRWAAMALELPRPAQGTSHPCKDDLELDRGSWVPPSLAASRDVMLLWLVNVWLEVCALFLQGSAIPDLASLSGRGLNTEKRLGRPLKREPSRQLQQKNHLGSA